MRLTIPLHIMVLVRVYPESITQTETSTYTFLGLFAGETYDVYAYWYVGTHNAGVANYLVSDGLGVVVVRLNRGSYSRHHDH